MSAAPDRIRTLDLIRGVAVLGILAVNIASFAAPDSAAYSPDLPRPGSWADHDAYLATLILFEGKMRALFSILFGASLQLFVERIEASGRDGAMLQRWRLAWLLVLGYLHFALIWDGDILFLYALVGFAALGLRHLAPAQLVTVAMLVLAVWLAWGAAMWAPSLALEHAAPDNRAAQIAHSAAMRDYRDRDVVALAEHRLDWPGEVAARAADRPAYPLKLALFNWGETLPWMLLGIALLKSGFFAGGWSAAQLRRAAIAAIGLGGIATLAFAAWVCSQRYPELTMRFATSFGLAPVHLALALGYGAVLVLAAPRLLGTAAGGRLEAAGRMAFSNYIATSLLMTGLFNGWGLGLYARFGPAARWGFVLLAWMLMLGWSQWWLLRFRQGPLEWLWRSLTEWRALPFKR